MSSRLPKRDVSPSGRDGTGPGCSPDGQQAGGRYGGGCGRRNRFYATGVPFSEYSPGPDPAMDPEQEAALLRAEADRLRSVLDTIEQRLEQLDNAREQSSC